MCLLIQVIVGLILMFGGVLAVIFLFELKWDYKNRPKL